MIRKFSLVILLILLVSCKENVEEISIKGNSESDESSIILNQRVEAKEELNASDTSFDVEESVELNLETEEAEKLEEDITEANVSDNFEKIDLYSSVDTSTFIDEVSLNQVENIKFLHTFEIIDSELVQWFECLYDKNTVYIYKPIDSTQKYNTILSEDHKFIFYDKSIETVSKNIDIIASLEVSNVLAPVGYYVNYTLYEGIYGSIISHTTKEKYYVNDFIIPSPTLKRFIVPWIVGYDNMTVIQIYEISESGISLEYEYVTEEWEPSNFEWNDDSEILFNRKFFYDTNSSEDQKENVKLHLLNKKWIIDESKDYD
ncbi:MAG: hypothetical protein JEZ08_25195 [Clostridiales bacterium]|nr:hypothetical protein [Clostridiales bacterium]